MVFLAAYDPLWPDEFRAEADRIRGVCDDLEVRVEHIGSTAVPGLSAKPIIDILAGVPSRAEREPYVQALKEIGYEHLGPWGIPGRNYFRRGRPRSHLVHLVGWSGAFWRDHLLFRDYLRANPTVMREYEVLKRQLAITHAEDPRQYVADKSAFIQAVLRDARAPAAP